ncbi:phytanoyl-CoA dioxygenase family protein [Diaporthe helianthi]|uniref:Phytanoyl-CoA dioxygenase family protein n=1 Tax=Diaporthe helianthi TaxID=158607 RepID=A0A2P5HQ69_DIAHE|nr:phytanoyl-CoA dioxygenase family protein [Diaporthe helianthi]
MAGIRDMWKMKISDELGSEGKQIPGSDLARECGDSGERTRLPPSGDCGYLTQLLATGGFAERSRLEEPPTTVHYAGVGGGGTNGMTRPSHPSIIRSSEAELHNKQLASRNLELAVRASAHRWTCALVVEDVVPHQDLDGLNDKMQDPPPVARNFHNPIFKILGPRPQTRPSAPPIPPCRCRPRQPPAPVPALHHPSDNRSTPTPTLTTRATPSGLVINIPLVTMTPENGSTEVWLGTHTHTADVSAQEGGHRERGPAGGRGGEVRGQPVPSQPVVRKGSIVLRDLRLWHAGMPNWACYDPLCAVVSEPD